MNKYIKCKVVPLSGTQKCVLEENGLLKCYLKAAPVKGRANKELIEIFAKKLGLPKYTINVSSGLLSRNKTISIETLLSQDEIKKRLLDE